ncbi:amino acid adenylation protein [Photobacterium galatheae]|uniref:Amino acid adenylation protein n=2 Tax=Photobacterium galatheae TaxID=1654360 RepID=A0A066RS83_9GAMM|nr:amino acid adenylation protein [Photobacterium galatheae]
MEIEIDHGTATLLDMFSEQARLNPDKIAVTDCHQSLSYLDFYLKVLKTGHRLADAQLSDENCIGLFCEPSIDMVCGAWGILASGNAYLPLAPEYPSERIRYMIQDSKIRVIYTQTHLKSKLEAMVSDQVTIVTAEDITALLANELPQMSDPVFSKVTPDHLAYVIYTSGSTGKPKGVMIKHRNIVQQMSFLKQTFSFGGQTRILQKTPMSFDAAQWEILAPVFGCHLIVGPAGCYRDPDEMVEVLLKHEINVLQCVPTLLQALVDHPSFIDCKSLAQVFSGGETLTRQLAKEFYRVRPEAELINLYGPTECTINSSYFKLCEKAVDTYPSAISIGKPVAHTRYYLLREDGQPALVGEIGELYISGRQVASGYLHRSDLTKEKFVPNHLSQDPEHAWLYRTGDLGRWDSEGNVHFAGRADNQVKLRGYRVELDEIRHAIENHSWIKNAAMVINNDPRTGSQNLIACIELDETQAALMDQGNHGSHHQSKANKCQVKAQLSNAGCRPAEACEDRLHIALEGKVATPSQKEKAFGRKTYRFFEREQPVTREELISLLTLEQDKTLSREISQLTAPQFGGLLRHFGQFISDERLLPKYTYASPGALYAVQLYIEIHGLFGWPSGIYYYHPVQHCLVQIEACQPNSQPTLKLHFIGKHDAIEPVYKNNILEVLEMETGHMLGLFDEQLPEFGLAIGAHQLTEQLPAWYDGATDDYNLGTFEICPNDVAPAIDLPELFVQAHGSHVAGLEEGLYRFTAQDFEYMSDQQILKRDVIAINQQVYDRASFGISMVENCRESAMRYISLGRTLHKLQSNPLSLGMMSSGYSSKSGNDLPSAKRMRHILNAHGLEMAAFYFCIGGGISQAQYLSIGMKEDSVHMRGPTEMIKDDLMTQLPQYMIPNKVVMIDKLPQTANGKVDYQALKALDVVANSHSEKEFIPLSTETEHQLGEIWCRIMKWDSVSAQDDFFECGGNSLTAVAMINRINQAFGIKVPLQVLFQSPTIQQLSAWIDSQGEQVQQASRLIELNGQQQNPIFCWPGLGGYPMNLKLMANQVAPHRQFFGVQALGLHEGEVPLPNVQEMAKADIELIRSVQPKGPYTLWGYSFGARVAFETAYQLEQMGETVEALHLIAPGSPQTHYDLEQTNQGNASFSNPVFVTILFSVFAHSIDGALLQSCLNQCHDEESFIEFMCQRFPMLQPDLIQRITRIVLVSYDFSYTFEELVGRRIHAPVTIFKAQQDNYSFIENVSDFSVEPPRTIHLEADHYQVLKAQGVAELQTHLI